VDIGKKVKISPIMGDLSVTGGLWVRFAPPAASAVRAHRLLSAEAASDDVAAAAEVASKGDAAAAEAASDDVAAAEAASDDVAAAEAASDDVAAAEAASDDVAAAEPASDDVAAAVPPTGVVYRARKCAQAAASALCARTPLSGW
jgi:hypothetical protein